MTWTSIERPGYFGRQRDRKINGYNTTYGEGYWRLVWILDDKEMDFVQACKEAYEESYFQYLKDRPKDLDFICCFGECIDNAPTNIQSGLDYSKQEAFSTHIQDIAVRNVLHRLGLKFNGPLGSVLTIRTKDSNGFRFGPGNVPFYDPTKITQPSLIPTWGNPGTVEDFWQSNKWLQVKVYE
jgi:hypothetical protein